MVYIRHRKTQRPSLRPLRSFDRGPHSLPRSSRPPPLPKRLYCRLCFKQYPILLCSPLSKLAVRPATPVAPPQKYSNWQIRFETSKRRCMNNAVTAREPGPPIDSALSKQSDGRIEKNRLMPVLFLLSHTGVLSGPGMGRDRPRFLATFCQHGNTRRLARISGCRMASSKR